MKQPSHFFIKGPKSPYLHNDSTNDGFTKTYLRLARSERLEARMRNYIVLFGKNELSYKLSLPSGTKIVVHPNRRICTNPILTTLHKSFDPTPRCPR